MKKDKNNYDYPVDMVYLWVDGNDPVWKARHDAAVGRVSTTSATDGDGRYVSTDELKYSLRSLEMYAPWIRRVFVVTDGQTPTWLDTSNQRVQVVDHSEILPEAARPCFNSSVIENFLWRIPGLSEHFLYGNDDMYFNQPVTKADFFDRDGNPYIRLNRRPLRRLYLFIKMRLLHGSMSSYNRRVHRAAMLVKDKLGKYYSGKMHHNIDAYLKSAYEQVHLLFRNEIEASLPNHTRADNDVQRTLYSLGSLATHHGHLMYVSRNESFRLHIQNESHYSKLVKARPLLFCMNDSEYATDIDRQRSASYLAKRFPTPSKFEKPTATPDR